VGGRASEPGEFGTSALGSPPLAKEVFEEDGETTVKVSPLAVPAQSTNATRAPASARLIRPDRRP
jgi:hypothetical protein